IEKELQGAADPKRLSFDAADLKDWDSGLLAYLVELQEFCRARNLEFDAASLPEGARRLIALASAVPERQRARRGGAEMRFLAPVGNETMNLWRSSGDMLAFLGEAMQAFGRLLIGQARFRRSDLTDVMFECGAAALPIVTLISFLVGLILAFVGAIQLQQF